MWIRRETLQIANCISFQSEHPLELMHLFFYASLPGRIELWRCFEMFCYCHLRAIYTCFHSPRTCLLSLCHISLFTLTFTHTHSHFDAKRKPQLSPHLGLVCQVRPPVQRVHIIESNRFRGPAVACWEYWSQICACVCNKASVQGTGQRFTQKQK